MSERPTPETDAETAAEAKRRAEWLHKHKAHKDWIILSVSEIAVIRGELLAVERERDEARDALKEWQTLCLWGGTPEHIHDFIKGQQTRIHEAQDIEKTCEQLERERDEANELLASEKFTRNHIIMRSVEVEKERDEAREELRAFNHDKKHLCESHMDMMGNCMICSMEETK